MSHKNKEIVSRFIDEVINKRNADAVDKLVATDFSRTDAQEGASYSSRAELKAAIGRPRSFTGGKLEVVSLLAEGDRVAVHMRGSGTHTGSFNGIRGSGSDAESSGAAIVTLKNGKITKIESHWDYLGLGRQIGVNVSAPADF